MPQRRFVQKVHVGMTAAEVADAVGQPTRAYNRAEADEVFRTFGDYWHCWTGYGPWPKDYDRILEYHTAFNASAFLFVGKDGKVLVVVVGKT
jgi:hypothetical protein